MLRALTALGNSRKALAIGAVILACTVLVALGKLSIDKYVNTISALVAVLTAAIAWEDGAAKRAGEGPYRTIAAVATVESVDENGDRRTPPAP